MEYETLVRTSHGVSQNTYHLIWCTKARCPAFKRAGMQRVVADFVKRSAKRHNIQIFECRVAQDHVHVFARLPRGMAVARALQLLKGNSAYYLRRYCRPLLKYKALWSKFTFSRTVGSVTGAVIEHYIKESNTKGWYGAQIKLQRYTDLA